MVKRKRKIRRPRKLVVRTLPEQIADDLAGAIARGEHRGGERLLETELAQHYGVSRGPVREAIRLVAQRGLAVLYPRRGAYVVELSLDTLVDLFNTRAVLMGLATRYFAAMASAAAHQELGAAIEELKLVSEARDTRASDYVKVTTKISLAISGNCGSESLARVIAYQNESSIWGILWRKTPIDFESRARRRVATADYVELADALRHGQGGRADATMRRMILRSRENAVASLTALRGASFDSRRLLTA